MLTREETAGTTLEVLAPYLPYGIQIEYSNWHGRPKGKLLGLCVQDIHNAILVDFGGVDGRREASLDLKHSLPCLLPFSALCEPLEDGTVPAVEVAKLAMSLSAESGPFTPHQGYAYHLGRREFKSDNVKVEYPWEGTLIEVIINKAWQVFIATKGDSGMSQPDNYVAILGYLRSKHFAVGLTESQYIALSPAPSTAIEKDSSLPS